jgi:hypothetical protein
MPGTGPHRASAMGPADPRIQAGARCVGLDCRIKSGNDEIVAVHPGLYVAQYHSPTFQALDEVFTFCL